MVQQHRCGEISRPLEERPVRLARTLDDAAGQVAGLAPDNPANLGRSSLKMNRPKATRPSGKPGLSTLIALQEELDWEVYGLYGLLDDDLTYAKTPPGIELGQRAFEIVLAQKMAAGELRTHLVRAARLDADHGHPQPLGRRITAGSSNSEWSVSAATATSLLSNSPSTSGVGTPNRGTSSLSGH